MRTQLTIHDIRGAGDAGGLGISAREMVLLYNVVIDQERGTATSPANCPEISRATFYRAKKTLLQRGYVQE